MNGRKKNKLFSYTIYSRNCVQVNKTIARKVKTNGQLDWQNMPNTAIYNSESLDFEK